jgi:hypothetical protein
MPQRAVSRNPCFDDTIFAALSRYHSARIAN